MFEAFKIGVTMSLANTVSSALSQMSKDFGNTGAAADAFQAKLKKIQTIGAAGALIGAAGYGGLKFLETAYNSASKYEQAFARFKSLNLGDAANAQADKFAMATNVMGVSSTELMANLRDLTSLLGDANLAQGLAPKFAQLNWANKAVFGGGAMQWDKNQTRDLERIIEIKGGYKSGQDFWSQANMMEQVVAGTGGMVKPSDFLQFIKTAGVSGRLLDNQAFYYTMEPLIQEMNGGRVGTGTMSAYNNLAQGRSTVRAAREMMRLGLVNRNDVEYDKIGQVKSIHPGALTNFEGYTSNPFKWMQDTLIPALQKAGFNTQQQMLNEMGAIFGNRTGSNLFGLMLTQQDKIEKNMRISQNAMDANGVIGLAGHTPQGATEAFAAAMDRLQTALGRSLIPVVVPAINAFARSINFITDIVVAHPTMTRILVELAGALSGLAIIGGGLLVFTAAFMGFKIVFGAAAIGLASTVGLIVAGLGVAVVGAYEIYQHWGTVKTALASVWQDIKDWLSNLLSVLSSIWNMHWGKDPSQGSRSWSIGAPPQPQAPVQVQSHIYIDGKPMTSVVSKGIYKSLDSDFTSPARFDPSASFFPAAQP